MDSYMQSLTDRIGSAWQAQKDLLTRIGDEKRDITPEERTQIERMDAETDALIAERKRYSDRRDIVAAADNFRAAADVRIESAREERREPTDRERLVQLIREGQPGRDFVEFRFSPASQTMDVRALQSAGGSAVATNFADLVAVYQRTVDPIFDMATVLDTPSGNPLVIPTWTADAAGGGTVTAENGGITSADGTISQITLGIFGYKSIQPVSTQLWRDSSFNIEDMLARTAGRQLGIAVGSAYAFADGNSGPNGYVAGGSAGKTATGTASGTANDTFFSPSDVVDLFHSVVVPWRAVGSWMVSNTAMAKIRKFRDSNGYFMYDPGIAQQPQTTLLGRPVYESPSLAAVASASKSVIFGDWSEYYIRRLPLRLDVSTEYLWVSDGIAVRTIFETDGDIAHPTAIRPMVSANT